MTWSAPGVWEGTNATALGLSNQGIGNLLIAEVINFSNSTVWCTGFTGGGATWTQAGVKFSGTTNAWSAAIFLGTITATGAQTATPTWSGTAPANYGTACHEFQTTTGSWTFITQANLDSAGTNTWPSLTAQAGDLYFGYAADQGTATAGSTSGYVYNASVDSVGNGAAYNLNCPSGATAPVWGDSGQGLGIMILVREGSGTPVSVASYIPVIAPGWFPSRKFPGSPEGTPFYAPRIASIPAPGVTSSADTSLAVTASITADAVAGAGSSRQLLGQPGSRPRWAALLRNKTRRSRYFTVPATGLQTLDASVSVTAGITADSLRVVSADTSVTVTAGITADAVAGGESTRQIITQRVSRPRWAALLRAKQRRNRYFGITFPPGIFSADASVPVTTGITAAVTETASANTSLTVTAGITAAAQLTQRADASLAVTDTITAAATGNLNAAASLAVTAGITATAAVGIAANLAVTAGIAAAASNTTGASSSLAVTAGISAAAGNVTSDSAAVSVTAGITAGITAVYNASASAQVTAGITPGAVMIALISAGLAVTAGISSDISRPSSITVTIAIKWNTDTLTVPASTLLASHWKSMGNDTRLMARDGVKYMSGDTRGSVKDGVKYMTNGGYK